MGRIYIETYPRSQLGDQLCSGDLVDRPQLAMRVAVTIKKLNTHRTNMKSGLEIRYFYLNRILANAASGNAKASGITNYTINIERYPRDLGWEVPYCEAYMFRDLVQTRGVDSAVHPSLLSGR